jgi:hypothetical protein
MTYVGGWLTNAKSEPKREGRKTKDEDDTTYREGVTIGWICVVYQLEQ